MDTSLGRIDTLDFTLPVFLPGSNRDWTEYGGVARITTNGEVFVKLQDERAAKGLVALAKDNILLQLGFDYRMTPSQIKELNERYTKRIVSMVGEFPVLGSGVEGTAVFKTDGSIEITIGDEFYMIDTTKKDDAV